MEQTIVNDKELTPVSLMIQVGREISFVYMIRDSYIVPKRQIEYNLKNSNNNPEINNLL